ncbi:MAG: nicotinate-nicotinamide nucleotide adenylyltransferase, partial [Acidobacteria bacterium]|nr:nicotinate-nicotinamide nucleotide adenylyltransferase [Acidobacteriota bacterium]
PPHRPQVPHATASHRFALTALAINGIDGYRVSDLEMGREGRSYTADTLRHLQSSGWTPSQLFFVIGADAFAEIATWREYPTVLDLSHFAVIARPGTTIDSAMAKASALHSRVRPIAAALTAARGTAIFWVEASTRDVSSTMIRARLAAGLAIHDLVPAPVARHIVAHHLYTEDDLHGEDKDREG